MAVAESTFAASVMLLADEASPLQLRKAIVRCASEQDLKELQSICADVLFGRIAISGDWKRQLSRQRERVYALGEADSAAVFRRLLDKAANLRALGLVLASALNVILGRDDVAVSDHEETAPQLDELSSEP